MQTAMMDYWKLENVYLLLTVMLMIHFAEITLIMSLFARMLHGLSTEAANSLLVKMCISCAIIARLNLFS